MFERGIVKFSNEFLIERLSGLDSFLLWTVELFSACALLMQFTWKSVTFDHTNSIRRFRSSCRSIFRKKNRKIREIPVEQNESLVDPISENKKICTIIIRGRDSDYVFHLRKVLKDFTRQTRIQHDALIKRVLKYQLEIESFYHYFLISLRWIRLINQKCYWSGILFDVQFILHTIDEILQNPGPKRRTLGKLCVKIGVTLAIWLMRQDRCV